MAPPSSLATISWGPNDPVPEALCARPPDQISRRPARDTCNAAGKVHMLRINRLMGFRKVGETTLWQLTV